MGRLTQKDEQGNWSLRGVPWESLYEWQVITRELHDRLYGALWKLMEYEDTGLSPEEVERLNDLRTKPFIASEDFILLDNGYVILREAYFKELRMSRGLVSTDARIIATN